MTEWRPIDSAPKDGTRILVASNGLVDTAYWATVSGNANCWGQDYTGWVNYDSEDPFYSVFYDGATHWMPLPDPPGDNK